jgi:hypothetical protein
MMVMKYFIRVFVSLRTTIWLLWILLAVFFAGAVLMPGRQEFRTIHSVPLFDWLIRQPLSTSWWLWVLIGALVLLALNTLFCSIESILKKSKITQWLLLISPQIIHLGFLCIMMAHLLSAAGGSQAYSYAGEGTVLKITENKTFLKIKDISIHTSSRGYITDWSVNVEYFSNGESVLKDRISPNRPSINFGLNINVKDLKMFPHKIILLQINKEPGAVLALTGGILFVAGILILIALRIKTEKNPKKISPETGETV